MYLQNEPMSRHTSFRIGGNADFFAAPCSIDELCAAVAWAKNSSIPWMVMGNGSNLLVSDEGIRGLVIKLTAMNGLALNDCRLTAECGALLSQLASYAAKAQLAGLAFAHGIPGTVGGAVYMNAGAYGGDIAGVLSCSKYMDENGDIRVLEREAHKFGYRHSFYSEHTEYIIVSAEVELSPGNEPEILNEMGELSRKRREKQPVNYPSAGSIFKRPEGQYAGTLIERCGLKGFQIGGAQVSELHAGFIINIGGATCADVLNLISHIQETVLRETGYFLETEVKKVGQ